MGDDGSGGEHTHSTHSLCKKQLMDDLKYRYKIYQLWIWEWMCFLVGMCPLTERRSLLLLSATRFYWWWWRRWRWRWLTAAIPTTTTSKPKTTIRLYFSTHTHTRTHSGWSWSHWVMWDPCTHAFNAHRPHLRQHTRSSKSSYTFTDWWIDCVNGNHKNQIDDKKKPKRIKARKRNKHIYFWGKLSSPIEIWWRKNNIIQILVFVN